VVLPIECLAKFNWCCFEWCCVKGFVDKWDYKLIKIAFEKIWVWCVGRGVLHFSEG